jgi:hypothetical protein
VVPADGRLRWPGAAIANYRAMPERRLRLARSPMSTVRDPRQPPARRYQASARNADMEAGSGPEMPVVPDVTILAAGTYDQAHERARDRALDVGSSGR